MCSLDSYYTRFPLESQVEPHGNADQQAIQNLEYFGKLKVFFDKAQKAFYDHSSEMVAGSRLLVKVIDLQNGSVVEDHEYLKTRCDVPTGNRDDKFVTDFVEKETDFFGIIEPTTRVENLALKIFTWAVGAYAMGRYVIAPSVHQRVIAAVAFLAGAKVCFDYVQERVPHALTLNDISEASRFRVGLLQNWNRESGFVLRIYQAALTVWTVAYALNFVDKCQPVASQAYLIAACVIVGKWAYDVATVAGLFEGSVIAKMKERIKVESNTLALATENYKVEEEERLVSAWKKRKTSLDAKAFEGLLKQKMERSERSEKKATGSGRAESHNLTKAAYQGIHKAFEALSAKVTLEGDEKTLVSLLTQNRESQK